MNTVGNKLFLIHISRSLSSQIMFFRLSGKENEGNEDAKNTAEKAEQKVCPNMFLVVFSSKIGHYKPHTKAYSRREISFKAFSMPEGRCRQSKG